MSATTGVRVDGVSGTQQGQVIVRGMEPRDAEALHAIMLQASSRLMTLQLPYHPLARWQDAATPHVGVYSLIAELDGTVVGNLGLHLQVNRRAHVADFGMAVHDGYRGRGVGRALLNAMLDLADNWLNIMRIELHVYVDNDAAIGLYRSAGFEIEGRHRAYAYRDGVWVDAYSMARLRERPPLPSNEADLAAGVSRNADMGEGKVP